MQPASTTVLRFRMWLALGAACSIVAAAGIATSGTSPQLVMPPMPDVVAEATVEPTRTTERGAPPLAIVVVASRSQIARGEPLPLAFYAVNRTAGPLPVLRSLDGSDVGWRYPMIEVEIRDARGRLVEGGTVGRCGLINPLSEADFVEVASGDRVDLFGEDSFSHHKLRNPSGLMPGRYTVTLHYDLSFAQPERLLQIDEHMRAKIDTLPKGVYSSPPITIEVE